MLLVLIKKRLHIVLLSCLILVFVPLSFTSEVSAAEYIKDYRVYIQVNPDSSLLVNEQITVNAEQNQIKRGIYRDFPTKYKTKTGYNKNTTFKVQSVSKNGKTEPYHTENLSNGKRLYIGSSDTYLKPGLYTYNIEYLTEYQVGYFDSQDEVYYNAIGTGWSFPIYSASAVVELPKKVPLEDLQLTSYLGPQDSANTEDVQIKVNNNRETTQVLYEVDKSVVLNPNEGLTVVAGFPKDIVTQPSKQEQVIKFIKDNLRVLLLILSTIAGLIIVPGIYLYYWLHYGRDPQTRGVVRNYDTPETVSPASARYITQMKFDNKALTAVIIGLAVKGYLTIKEDKKLLSKKFTLLKNIPKLKSNLYQDEKAVYDYIFSNAKTKYVFDKKDYTQTQALISNLKTALEQLNKGAYVLSNSRYMVLPVALNVILFLLGGFNFAILIILIPVHIIFFYALKARTKEGKLLYDKIMGLKQYLSAVEEPRYTSKLHNDIPFNIGVYEKYLPYAVALDVEPLWSKRLKNYINSLQDKKELDNHMLWYVGSRNVFDSGFSSSITNSLSSSISSASTAPGSSSGFSGGSSGGGGGGGGGGGW